MAKHTIKGWLSMTTDPDINPPIVQFQHYKPSGEYFAPIREHSFEVEVPDDFDPRPAVIAALEKERDKVRAEAAEKVRELTARIAELQAIEYTPTVEA